MLRPRPGPSISSPRQPSRLTPSACVAGDSATSTARSSRSRSSTRPVTLGAGGGYVPGALLLGGSGTVTDCTCCAQVVSAFAGYLWGERSNAASSGEHDLARGVPVQHRPETLFCLLHGQFQADLRADPGIGHESEQIGQLVAGPHGGSDDAELQEEQALEVGTGVRAAGRAGDHDHTTGA